MNLDEYKAYVEATRKESLLKAIATMSEANDKMSSLFNTKEAELMGYVEIFRMDNEGAGWVDLSEATPDELFNIELGLLEEGAFE